MSYERDKQDTRLTVLETEIVHDRLAAERYRDTLRDLLDQIVAVETLQRDSIVAVAMKFADIHITLAEKLATIKKIKDFLGPR